jgi:outer membrane lipoprotein-sorting protein
MRIATKAGATGCTEQAWCKLARAVLVSCIIASLTGCVVRNRTPLPPAPLAPSLQSATLEELLERVEKQQAAIQTLDAVVQIEPSVTSEQRGEIVTYRDVRAFVLIRKPAHLRMIGQYPVVRSTAFDLVSDGERFGLYIPSKNRYIVGNSQGGKRSKSALENLRPQHILDALLLEGPEAGREQAAREVASEGRKSYYIVLILRREDTGGLLLARKLWFEREHLTLARLQIFDPNGEVETDARYSSYAEFSGISYPQQIVLDRPQDDYGLMLTVTEMEFNQPLEDDKFEMARPSGAEIVDMEQTPT